MLPVLENSQKVLPVLENSLNNDVLTASNLEDSGTNTSAYCIVQRLPAISSRGKRCNLDTCDPELPLRYNVDQKL